MTSIPSLERALRIEGYTSASELAFLQTATLAFENAIVADVGTWKGRSAVAFAEAGATVVAVDAFSGVEGTLGAFNEETLTEFEQNVSGLPITALRADTVAGAARFTDGFFQIVFIDADHSYDAVRRDIHAWAPKVAFPGVLCGHDFGAWDSVTRGVKELFGDHVFRWESVWFTWSPRPRTRPTRFAKNQLAPYIARAKRHYKLLTQPPPHSSGS
jgi:hypothetical protein